MSREKDLFYIFNRYLRGFSYVYQLNMALCTHSRVKYFKINRMKEKKRISLTAMSIIVISFFTVALSGVLGTVLTAQSVHKMKDMVSSKTIELASTAAALLDGESIKNITAEDAGTKPYQDAITILRKFKSSNEGSSGEFAYIYLCREVSENTFEFTIDPDAEDAAEFGKPLESTWALEQAADGKTAFDKEPYTDEWGTFYSAYAPVFDNDVDKNVVMIVGIDVWAEWYENAVWSNSRSIIIICAIGVATGIVMGILVSLRIRSKFKLLSKEIDNLENDVRALVSDIAEPSQIERKEHESDIKNMDQIIQIREQIHKTQNEIKGYIEYMKKQVYIDSLAHVNNRSAYVERIEEIDLDYPFAVMIFDINGLKYTNDHFGHENGDESIITVANVLKSIFVEKDIFRIGGDEFVVILTNADKDATMALYNSFDAELKDFNDNRSKLPFKVYSSKGIAFYDKKVDKSYADVFNRADENMYKNKKEFYDKNPTLKNKHSGY